MKPSAGILTSRSSLSKKRILLEELTKIHNTTGQQIHESSVQQRANSNRQRHPLTERAAVEQLKFDLATSRKSGIRPFQDIEDRKEQLTYDDTSSNEEKILLAGLEEWKNEVDYMKQDFNFIPTSQSQNFHIPMFRLKQKKMAKSDLLAMVEELRRAPISDRSHDVHGEQQDIARAFMKKPKSLQSQSLQQQNHSKNDSQMFMSKSRMQTEPEVNETILNSIVNPPQKRQEPSNSVAKSSGLKSFRLISSVSIPSNVHIKSNGGSDRKQVSFKSGEQTADGMTIATTETDYEGEGKTDGEGDGFSSQPTWKIIKQIHNETNVKLIENLFLMKLKKRLDKCEQQLQPMSLQAQKGVRFQAMRSRVSIMHTQQNLVQEEIADFQEKTLESFQFIQEIKRNKSGPSQLLSLVSGSKGGKTGDRWRSEIVLETLEKEYARNSAKRHEELEKEWEELGKHTDKIEEVQNKLYEKYADISLTLIERKEKLDLLRLDWCRLMTQIQSIQKDRESALKGYSMQQAKLAYTLSQQQITIPPGSERKIAKGELLKDLALERSKLLDKEEARLKREYKDQDNKKHDEIEKNQQGLKQIQEAIDAATAFIQLIKKQKASAKKELKEFYLSLFRTGSSNSAPLIPITKLIQYMQGIGEEVGEDLLPEYFDKDSIAFVQKLQKFTMEEERLDRLVQESKRAFFKEEQVNSLTSSLFQFITSPTASQQAFTPSVQAHTSPLANNHSSILFDETKKQKLSRKDSIQQLMKREHHSTISQAAPRGSRFARDLEAQFLAAKSLTTQFKEAELERLVKLCHTQNSSDQRILNIKKILVFTYGAVEGNYWCQRFDIRRKEIQNKAHTSKTFSFSETRVHHHDLPQQQPVLLFSGKKTISTDPSSISSSRGQMSTLESTKSSLRKKFQQLQDPNNINLITSPFSVLTAQVERLR